MAASRCPRRRVLPAASGTGSPCVWARRAWPSPCTTRATRTAATETGRRDRRRRRPRDRGDRRRRRRGARWPRSSTTSRPSLGGIDVVVHAAGIMMLRTARRPGPRRPRPDAPHQHPRHLRRRPAGGPPRPRRRRDHQLLHLGQPSLAVPGYTAYAATKGAVEAMTLILARELRGRDITVNAVAPGPTATPLFLDGKDAGDHRPASPRRRRWSASGRPRTSRRSSPSSPGPPAGSTARSSTSTAASI